MLVVLVLVGRERHDRARLRVARRLGRAGGARGAGALDVTPALETRGLRKASAASSATHDVSFRLDARRAPRADRSERRRQDDARQPADRRARSRRAGAILLDGADITRLRAGRACARAASVRTFQINQLFGAMTPLETLGAAVSRARRRGQRLRGSRLARTARSSTKSSHRWALRPGRRARPAHGGARLRQAPPARDRDRAREPAARAAARRAGGRRARGRARARSWPPSRRCRATSRCC